MAAAALTLKALGDASKSIEMRKHDPFTDDSSLAAKQNEIVAETRLSFERLIADGARSPELMHFFDSALVDMMQRREDLFFARMMAAFKTEMQVQVKSSYSKAAEAARRAEFAEKEVERLEARLSRRTRDWEVERADYYRQILALRELLRRHGISEGDELRALAVTSAGTAGSDDPMGSTVRRALEAQVRSLESDLSKAQATVAELQARVSKAVAEDRDTRQRLAQSEEQLAIASRRSRDLTEEVAALREQVRALRASAGDSGRGGRGGSSSSSSSNSSSNSSTGNLDDGGVGSSGSGDTWMIGGRAWGETQRRLATARVHAGRLDWADAVEGLAELLVERSLREALMEAYQRRAQLEEAAGSRAGELVLPGAKADEEMRTLLRDAQRSEAEATVRVRALEGMLEDVRLELARTRAEASRLVRPRTPPPTVASTAQTDISGDIMAAADVRKQLRAAERAGAPAVTPSAAATAPQAVPAPSNRDGADGSASPRRAAAAATTASSSPSSPRRTGGAAAAATRGRTGTASGRRGGTSPDARAGDGASAAAGSGGMAAAMSAAAKAKATAEAADKRAQEAKTKAEAAEAARVAAEARLATAQKQVAELLKSKADVGARASKAEDSSRELGSRVETLEARVKELETDLANSRESAMQARRTLVTERANAAAAAASAAAARESAAGAEAAAARKVHEAELAATEEAERIRREKEEEAARLRNAEEDVRRRAALAEAEAQADVSKLAAAVREAQKESRDRSDELRHARIRVDEALTEASRARTALAVVQQDRDAAVLRVEDLSTQLREATAGWEATRTELAAMRAERDSLIARSLAAEAQSRAERAVERLAVAAERAQLHSAATATAEQIEAAVDDAVRARRAIEAVNRLEGELAAASARVAKLEAELQAASRPSEPAAVVAQPPRREQVTGAPLSVEEPSDTGAQLHAAELASARDELSRALAAAAALERLCIGLLQEPGMRRELEVAVSAESEAPRSKTGSLIADEPLWVRTVVQRFVAAQVPTGSSSEAQPWLSTSPAALELLPTAADTARARRGDPSVPWLLWLVSSRLDAYLVARTQERRAAWLRLALLQRAAKSMSSGDSISEQRHLAGFRTMGLVVRTAGRALVRGRLRSLLASVLLLLRNADRLGTVALASGRAAGLAAGEGVIGRGLGVRSQSPPRSDHGVEGRRTYAFMPALSSTSPQRPATAGARVVMRSGDAYRPLEGTQLLISRDGTSEMRQLPHEPVEGSPQRTPLVLLQSPLVGTRGRRPHTSQGLRPRQSELVVMQLQPASGDAAGVVRFAERTHQVPQRHSPPPSPHRVRVGPDGVPSPSDLDVSFLASLASDPLGFGRRPYALVDQHSHSPRAIVRSRASPPPLAIGTAGEHPISSLTSGPRQSGGASVGATVTAAPQGVISSPMAVAKPTRSYIGGWHTPPPTDDDDEIAAMMAARHVPTFEPVTSTPAEAHAEVRFAVPEAPAMEQPAAALLIAAAATAATAATATITTPATAAQPAGASVAASASAGPSSQLTPRAPAGLPRDIGSPRASNALDRAKLLARAEPTTTAVQSTSAPSAMPAVAASAGADGQHPSPSPLRVRGVSPPGTGPQRRGVSRGVVVTEPVRTTVTPVAPYQSRQRPGMPSLLGPPSSDGSDALVWSGIGPDAPAGGLTPALGVAVGNDAFPPRATSGAFLGATRYGGAAAAVTSPIHRFSAGLREAAASAAATTVASPWQEAGQTRASSPRDRAIDVMSAPAPQSVPMAAMSQGVGLLPVAMFPIAADATGALLTPPHMLHQQVLTTSSRPLDTRRSPHTASQSASAPFASVLRDELRSPFVSAGRSSLVEDSAASIGEVAPVWATPGVGVGAALWRSSHATATGGPSGGRSDGSSSARAASPPGAARHGPSHPGASPSPAHPRVVSTSSSARPYSRPHATATDTAEAAAAGGDSPARVVEGRVERFKGRAGTGIRIVGFRRPDVPGTGGAAAPLVAALVDPTTGQPLAGEATGGLTGVALMNPDLAGGRPRSESSPGRGRSRSRSASRSPSRSVSPGRGRSEHEAWEHGGRPGSESPRHQQETKDDAGAGGGGGGGVVVYLPSGAVVDAAGRMLMPATPSIPSPWHQQSLAAREQTLLRHAAQVQLAGQPLPLHRPLTVTVTGLATAGNARTTTTTTTTATATIGTVRSSVA